MTTPYEPMKPTVLDDHPKVTNLALYNRAWVLQEIPRSPPTIYPDKGRVTGLAGFLTKYKTSVKPKTRYLGETSKIAEMSNLKLTIRALKRWLAGRSLSDPEPRTWRSAGAGLPNKEVPKFYGDFNEPNAVDVATGGETTEHEPLDWKPSASAITSSASSDLGSKTDESSALCKTMVPKTQVETASAILARQAEIVERMKNERAKLRAVIIKRVNLGYRDDDLPFTRGEMSSMAFPTMVDKDEAPSRTHQILQLCTCTFPPRLFGQPVLMRRQRVFDPG